MKVQNFIESLCFWHLPYHWSFGNQTKCADLLLLITKQSTTKWAYTDSSTLTYSITRHITGGGGVVFCCAGDKPCFGCIWVLSWGSLFCHTDLIWCNAFEWSRCPLQAACQANCVRGDGWDGEATFTRAVDDSSRLPAALPLAVWALEWRVGCTRTVKRTQARDNYLHYHDNARLLGFFVVVCFLPRQKAVQSCTSTKSCTKLY